MSRPDSKPVQPRARLATWLTSPLLSLGLLATFAAYFGLLIFAVFELFRQLDRVLGGDWAGWHGALRVAGLLAIGVMAVRVAWRLALSILGLVTPKYDEWSLEDALPLEVDGELARVVADICRRVGSPHPDEVRVSAHDSCYVLEERRFSFRTRRRLVLVLGMPHLLVMTVGEIQVILAHELAHFRRGDTTLTVFLYRIDESARISAKQLRRHWWWWADPVYWFFAGFHRLFIWLSAPWQRLQELRADEISAAAFGGRHAAATLLKEWLVEGQFEAALDEYLETHQQLDPEETPYQHFAGQWRDYRPETHEYLERRLTEFERPGWFDPRPTIGRRLQVMREYPDQEEIDTRPARLLVPEDRLASLERELAPKLL